MVKERAIVIVDGSNFYHKLKSLNFNQLSSFDYNQFIYSLTKNDQLIRKYFCIGKVKASQNDKKARKMMADQQALVSRLKKENFIIQFGYLLKSENRYHEKGVDVQMAVDILKDAYQNIYDKAYLLSSDSDLLPAIIESQAIGKVIVYVGFRHQISYALINNCKKTLLLEKKDILPFFKI